VRPRRASPAEGSRARRRGAASSGIPGRGIWGKEEGYGLAGRRRCRDLGFLSVFGGGDGGREGERANMARVSPSDAQYIPSHVQTAG
jgi:hypothetical protein